MIYFEALGQMFDFGKFKGFDLGEVLMCSPDYVQWVMENVNGQRVLVVEYNVFII